MCHINYQVSFIQSNIGKVVDSGGQWMTGQRNAVFSIDYIKGQQYPAPEPHLACEGYLSGPPT